MSFGGGIVGQGAGCECCGLLTQECNTMKIYFAPRTIAVRTRWMVEEVGVPYELERVEPAALDTVLVDGAATFTDSAAACLYLADRFPDRGLAPAPSAP